MKKLITLSLTVLIALSANVALADVWAEIGDAGDLPATAQIPTGNDPLTAITGTILAGGDADMYCISIETPTAFSASTCFVTSIDTQLWIFAEDGTGISYNDDDPGGCGLQSTVTGTFILNPGSYYLAVSTYDWDALDGSGNEIWSDTPFNVERQPDGPGAPGPVAGWGGSSFSDGAYQIELTGAGFCGVTATEESSWSTFKSLYN